ncbi:hypothetical protein [Silvibacterium acidisoli]|uniref:hypothetical protein n=1 Tax=Acidobacteriaceae bacterium ZG23-2 TaxID=2883246 RepID=UPI00406C2DC5
MNETPFVLLYGRDSQLLETREWILETIGYPSQVASRLEEFQLYLQDRSLTLVIICHSVPAAETDAAIAAAHQRRPDLRMLVLVANASMRYRKTGERTFDTQEGPGLLIEAVQQLMADDDNGTLQQESRHAELKVVRLPVVPSE